MAALRQEELEERGASYGTIWKVPQTQSPKQDTALETTDYEKGAPYNLS